MKSNQDPNAHVRFKAVAAAFDALSDDSLRADATFDEQNRHDSDQSYRSGQSTNDSTKSDRARKFNRALTWIDFAIHPRILLLLIPTLIVASIMMYPSSKKKSIDDEVRVQAWFNPTSRRWESPQPWDDQFRSLNPDTQMVARAIVHEPTKIKIQ